jgi:heme oxygenase (biliverdin-producing, ferredoxin)
MRQSTAGLHADAERTGVVAALIRGDITQSRYALYLRNLLPAYEMLELALQSGRKWPGLAGLRQPSLFRSARIAADLQALVGPHWETFLPLLPAGAAYANRVGLVGTGELLIAHCYTRILGDLNGGQLIRRRLIQLFGSDFQALAFTAFPEIEDLRSFTAIYRNTLDDAAEHLADWAAVVDEAAVAFRMNIKLSTDVQAFEMSPHEYGPP